MLLIIRAMLFDRKYMEKVIRNFYLGLNNTKHHSRCEGYQVCQCTGCRDQGGALQKLI